MPSPYASLACLNTLTMAWSLYVVVMVWPQHFNIKCVYW
jgi:hypothetical protein